MYYKANLPKKTVLDAANTQTLAYYSAHLNETLAAYQDLAY